MVNNITLNLTSNSTLATEGLTSGKALGLGFKAIAMDPFTGGA